MAVKIVSDSTCDISRDMADQLGVTLVPAYVMFGQETFRQGIDINPSQFYARLQSLPQLPSTSQPAPGDFTERIESLVNDGHQVACITVPSQLSGTCNPAVQAAAQFPDGAVTVIDVGTASAGHLIQVIAAAEDSAGADATAEAVARAATACAASGFSLAVVDTLEYLQKGGRIGKAQAFTGSIPGSSRKHPYRAGRLRHRRPCRPRRRGSVHPALTSGIVSGVNGEAAACAPSPGEAIGYQFKQSGKGGRAHAAETAGEGKSMHPHPIRRVRLLLDGNAGCRTCLLATKIEWGPGRRWTHQQELTGRDGEASGGPCLGVEPGPSPAVFRPLEAGDFFFLRTLARVSKRKSVLRRWGRREGK